MTAKTVTIQEEIHAPLAKVFEWFYHSENYHQSPIVFQSKWTSQSKWTPGSKRDIIMIAGRYQEEITEVALERYIRYRVFQSFPSVKQEFTEIAFEELSKYLIRVTWTIEIEVPIPFGQKWVNALAGKMAGALYRTILKAGKKELEMEK